MHNGLSRDEALCVVRIDNSEEVSCKNCAIAGFDEGIERVEVVFDAGYGVCFCGGRFKGYV